MTVPKSEIVLADLDVELAPKHVTSYATIVSKGIKRFGARFVRNSDIPRSKKHSSNRDGQNKVRNFKFILVIYNFTAV